MNVNAGPVAKLIVQTQPSETETAGVAFAQQPVNHIATASKPAAISAAIPVDAGPLYQLLVLMPGECTNS